MPRGKARVSPILAQALSPGEGEGPGRRPGEADLGCAAIRDVVLAFLGAWVTGDEAGMIAQLHPERTKHLVQGGAGLGPRAALVRLQGIHATLGEAMAGPESAVDLRVLDMCGRSASARALVGGCLAYVHLSLREGRWAIVNVLWEWVAPPKRPTRTRT